MSLYEIRPNNFVVQIFRADPLKGRPLRLCRRVRGRDAAEKQGKEFKLEADAWVAKRRLVKEAQAKGLAIALPSAPSRLQDFPTYLECQYIP